MEIKFLLLSLKFPTHTNALLSGSGKAKRRALQGFITMNTRVAAFHIVGPGSSRTAPNYLKPPCNEVAHRIT